MRAPKITPRIITETTGPSRFNVGINLRPAERAALVKLMQKRGNASWEPPTDEVVVENLTTIANIMQQAPVGKQAIIGEGGK